MKAREARSHSVLLGLVVNPEQTADTCTHCCPWWLPCNLGANRQHGVALTYEEWIVYTLHVVHHQAKGLLS